LTATETGESRQLAQPEVLRGMQLLPLTRGKSSMLGAGAVYADAAVQEQQA
jgi:hypothetical protein